MNIYFVEKDNTISVRKLGIEEGQEPMVIVPKDTIFCAENINSNGYTFISCVTVPKFSSNGLILNLISLNSEILNSLVFLQ